MTFDRALNAVAPSLTGRCATSDETDLLRNRFNKATPEWFLSALREYPIIGCPFELAATATLSRRKVSTRWNNPAEMIREAFEQHPRYPGTVAGSRGYVPIGVCESGSGDIFCALLDQHGDGQVVRFATEPRPEYEPVPVVASLADFCQRGYVRPEDDRAIRNRAFLARGRDDVIQWAIHRVRGRSILAVTFESVRPEWRRGVRLRSDTALRVLPNGIPQKELILWSDPYPSVRVECVSENGLLGVYNVWDRGSGVEKLGEASGMLLENIPNGVRYQCNDVGFETSFDKLVFRIERETS